MYLSHVFNKRLDDRKDIRVIYFEIYIYAMHSTEQTKKMDIVEEPLSWFTDYLSNRKQDVVFNRKKSTGENFINDIISELNCRKILFADDTSILAVVKDPLVNVFS